MNQPTPAGWYPNPNGQGQRYWDGQQWTEHYHQDPPAAPAAPAAPTTPDPVPPASPKADPTPSAPTPPSAAPAPPAQPATPPPATPPPATPAPAAAPPPAQPAAPSPAAPSPAAPPPPQWSPTPSPQAPQPWAASPTPSSTSTATAPPFQIGHWVVMGAAALLLIACVLPWATVSGFGSSESDNAFESGLPWLLTGIDVDSGDDGSFAHGILFALAAIAAVVVAAVPATKSNKIIPAAIGGVTFALILINIIMFFSEFSDLEDRFGVDISVGFGAYIALAAAAGIVAGALIPATNYDGKQAPKSATPAPGPPY